MSLQQYYALFFRKGTVMDEVRISISDNVLVYTIAQENDHDILTEEDYVKAKEQALALYFIQGANPNYNAEYLVHLHSSHLEGNDICLKTLMEAYHTMSWCESSRGTLLPLDSKEGVSFSTRGQQTLEDKNQDSSGNCKSHIK